MDFEGNMAPFSAKHKAASDYKSTRDLRYNMGGVSGIAIT